MKIQFLKIFHAGTRTFCSGWVAEVSDPDGERLVAQGYAKEVSKAIRSRKYAPEVAPATECVVPERVTEKTTTVELGESAEPEKSKKLTLKWPAKPSVTDQDEE